MGRIADDAKTTARIWTIDIERIHGLTPIFDQRTSGFIPVSKWTRLPQTLCFAAKPYGRRDIEFHASWDDHDAMIQRSWEIYDEADIIIGFNQRRFDNKKLRGDWAMAGLPQPRPWKDVDLFAVAKTQFDFESKSLAHLCRVLGLPGKQGHWSPEAAEACMDGDEKARRDMERYNKGDCRITEAVADALRAWIPNHPHMTNSSAETLTCNRCASADLAKLPTDYRAVVLDYAQYRCNNCGGIVRAGHVRRVARTRGVS